MPKVAQAKRRQTLHWPGSKPAGPGSVRKQCYSKKLPQQWKAPQDVLQSATDAIASDVSCSSPAKASCKSAPITACYVGLARGICEDPAAYLSISCCLEPSSPRKASFCLWSLLSTASTGATMAVFMLSSIPSTCRWADHRQSLKQTPARITAGTHYSASTAQITAVANLCADPHALLCNAAWHKIYNNRLHIAGSSFYRAPTRSQASTHGAKHTRDSVRETCASACPTLCRASCSQL